MNETDIVRKIAIGDPSDPSTYVQKNIQVDSDHVDMSTYSAATTPADSLTKKIHDLEEATPDVATASTAGIVKPGAGLQMHPGSSDGTLDLAYDHALTLTDGAGTTLGTFNGSADVSVSVATIPTNHSSANTTYGVGDSSKYGHLKVTDTYKTAPAAGTTGLSLSAKAGNLMYEELKSGVGIELTQAQYDALPASEKNNGDYYITDGSLYPDTKVLTQTLVTGNTTVTFTDAMLTSTALVDVYTDRFGVDPVNMTSSTGSLTIEFPEQEYNVVVKIEIKEV